MEFIDFKNRVIGRDKNNHAKAAVGLISYIPEKTENSQNGIEYSINEMMTMKKPEVNMIYISDPFNIHNFIQLELKFISSYDPDLKDAYNFIDKFITEASNNFDNPFECPAFSVNIMPTDIYETEGNPPFMELLLPMMVSLCASRPNSYPDTIKILFDINNVTIHEEEILDKEEARREYIGEVEEAKLRAEEAQKELIRQKEREDREKELFEKMKEQENKTEERILVGRAAQNRNNEASDEEN